MLKTGIAPKILGRATWLGVATSLLAAALTATPATATSARNGFCDPGWTEVQQLTVMSTTPDGSVCLGPGPGAPVNMRVDMTNPVFPMTGRWYFEYAEYDSSGPTWVRQNDTGTYSPRSPKIATKTFSQLASGRTLVDIHMEGTYHRWETVLVPTPVSVLVPKSASQVKAASRVRDKAVAKAKKAYKKVVKSQKSAKTTRSKKAKRKYTKAVAAARSKYKRAIAPTRTTVNTVVEKRVPTPDQPWSYTSSVGIPTGWEPPR